MPIDIIISETGAAERINTDWQVETRALYDALGNVGQRMSFEQTEAWDALVVSLKSGTGAASGSVVTTTFTTTESQTFQHSNLIGATIVGVPVLDNVNMQDLPFDSSTGTFNASSIGGFSAGSKLTVVYQRVQTSSGFPFTLPLTLS